MVKITCKQCGNDIFTFPSRIGRKKYCSKKCLWKNIASKLVVPKLELKCKICNKIFYKTKSQMVGERGKYCSKKCEHTGKRKEGNPNWVGDKVSIDGGRQRARRWYQDNRCSVCNKESAERHHIDGNTKNNSPENIIFLCRKHHQERDGRIKNGRLFLNSNYP
jgi:hypothetical protein